jgi:hypothetical protein
MNLMREMTGRVIRKDIYFNAGENDLIRRAANIWGAPYATYCRTKLVLAALQDIELSDLAHKLASQPPVPGGNPKQTHQSMEEVS